MGFVDGALEVRITAAPVKGTANKALVEYLAHRLGISRSNITIVRGETSRRKVIEIEGTSQEDLLERLSAKNHSQGAQGIRAMPKREDEIYVRRLRVDEALARLDRYLNDAFLSGLDSVRVVHGKGTGTLRNAVREQLSNHPLVKSFRPGDYGEGDEGVTVVELAKLKKQGGSQ